MNLYETLGLIAIGAGLGAANGFAQASHHPLILPAVAVVVGILAGVIAFLTLRKAMTHLKQPTERRLAALYALTFVGVLVATWAATSGTLEITRVLTR